MLMSQTIWETSSKKCHVHVHVTFLVSSYVSLNMNYLAQEIKSLTDVDIFMTDANICEF